MKNLCVILWKAPKCFDVSQMLFHNHKTIMDFQKNERYPYHVIRQGLTTQKTYGYDSIIIIITGRQRDPIVQPASI